MSDGLNELYARIKRYEQGGGKERIVAQHQRGKFTARERLAILLDPDSFVELNPFMEGALEEASSERLEAPGEGVVTGHGTIDGRPVYVFSQDFTVYGGALGETHAKKIIKIMDLAYQNKAPIIGLNDSGGARIQEGVVSLDGYGHIFYRNAIYSGVIPQFSIILGPCAGGAVYSPALTDFVLMVDQTSQMFITGPKVIEAVTGEKISSEELGGAKVHASKSGNAHFIADNEKEAFLQFRKLFSYIPSHFQASLPPVPYQQLSNEDWNEAFLKVLPEDRAKVYDVRKVIALIVDYTDFFEVQAQFAKNIVVGFGRIEGNTVGFVANQPKIMAGSLDINSADKLARFVRFCDCFNIPLVTLEDVTGFFPGVQQEHGGIIRHGAKILYAYSEATVPKITLILRKAYGGAYVALNSKSIGADIVYAWPQAEIAVMGAEGAVNVIYAKELKESDHPEQLRMQKINEYRSKYANPYIAAARGMVDDVIDPRATRKKIKQALNMLKQKKEGRPQKKHDNLPL